MLILSIIRESFIINKKGFTFIELLGVIAIIAILVSIILPLVSDTTVKAKAGTDAANIRAILAALNIEVLNGDKTVQEILDSCLHPYGKTDPDSKLQVVYDATGFIDAYYVNGSKYYGLTYLSEVAELGFSSYPITKPDIPGGVWYTVDP